MESWSARCSSLKGQEKAIINQTNTVTVLKVTLQKPLRDEVQCIIMDFSQHRYHIHLNYSVSPWYGLDHWQCDKNNKEETPHLQAFQILQHARNDHDNHDVKVIPLWFGQEVQQLGYAFQLSHCAAIFHWKSMCKVTSFATLSVCLSLSPVLCNLISTHQ